MQSGLHPKFWIDFRKRYPYKTIPTMIRKLLFWFFLLARFALFRQVCYVFFFCPPLFFEFLFRLSKALFTFSILHWPPEKSGRSFLPLQYCLFGFGCKYWWHCLCKFCWRCLQIPLLQPFLKKSSRLFITWHFVHCLSVIYLLLGTQLAHCKTERKSQKRPYCIRKG
jgi:hypothetical protein